MALDNATVLENLRKQRVEVEQGLETTREMYLKLIGAIEVLEQIEDCQCHSLKFINYVSVFNRFRFQEITTSWNIKK